MASPSFPLHSSPSVSPCPLGADSAPPGRASPLCPPWLHGGSVSGRVSGPSRKAGFTGVRWRRWWLVLTLMSWRRSRREVERLQGGRPRRQLQLGTSPIGNTSGPITLRVGCFRRRALGYACSPRYCGRLQTSLECYDCEPIVTGSGFRYKRGCGPVRQASAPCALSGGRQRRASALSHPRWFRKAGLHAQQAKHKGGAGQAVVSWHARTEFK